MSEPFETLGDDGRLRRVAFAVLRDESRADDVLQEAWILTLNKRPPARQDRRAWLTGVVRNLALNARRGELRRRRRERSAARHERVEPETEALDRRAVLEHLFERVEQLEEPLRSPVRLHYVEGRPVAQVAAELGRPLPTVRDQLRRGVESLRAGMTARFGDRRAWGVVLVGAFDWDAEEVCEALGIDLVRSVSRYALPAAGLVGAGLLAVWVTNRVGDDHQVSGTSDQAEQVAEIEPSRAPVATDRPEDEPPGVRRVADAGTATGVVDLASDEREPYAKLRLRVVDPLGGPIPDTRVLITVQPESIGSSEEFSDASPEGRELPAGTTDIDGWLGIAVRREWLTETSEGELGLRVSLRSDHHASRWMHTITLAEGEEPVVPVVLDEPSCPITVRVVGGDGSPLPAERVRAVPELGGGSPVLREGRVVRTIIGTMTSPGADGEFRVRDAGCGRVKLATFVDGVGLGFATVDASAEGEVELRVGPARRVFGRVLSEDGTPVAGARVRCEVMEQASLPLAWSSALSDEGGAYELWLGDVSWARILAEHPRDAGMVVAVNLPYSPGRDVQRDLVFARYETLRVRLLDPAGAPLSDWHARPLDPKRYTVPGSMVQTTDEQGRVEFRLHGDQPVDVGVMGKVPASQLVRWTFPQLQPGEGEHELVLDPYAGGECAILGELGPGDWDAPCSFSLQVCQQSSSESATFELPCPGEVFAFEDLPAGPVELYLVGKDALRFPLGFHDLTPGGFVDLGLVTPPQPVRVRIQAPAALEPGTPAPEFLIANGSGFCTAPILALSGWPEDPIELFPGAYFVRVMSNSRASRLHGFEVQAQPEVTIELPLELFRRDR